MSPRSGLRVVGVAAIVVLAVPSAVEAHAAYKDSDPADESTVTSAPSELWAEFTEPPAEGSSLSVFNECGDRVDAGDSRIDGFRIYIGLDSPHRGGFRVDFRVTSAYDSHVTRGSFTFTATGGDDCAAPPPDAGDGNDGGDESGAAGGGGNDGAGGSADPDGGEAGLTEVASLSGRGEGDGSRASRRGGRDRAGEGRGREGTADAAVENAAQPIAETEDPTPGIWEGIQLRDLMVGYALAMLIGAAGGKIYAAIVGPRR